MTRLKTFMRFTPFFCWYWVCFLLVLGVTACDAGGGTEKEYAVFHGRVSANTIVLDDRDLSAIVRMNYHGGKIFIHPDSALASRIREGMIILMPLTAQPESGFVVKVKQVIRAKDFVELYSDPAPLSDAFDEFHLEILTRLTPDAIDEVTNLADGVTFIRPTAPGTEGVRLRFNRIMDDSGGKTVGVSGNVSVSGSFRIDVNVSKGKLRMDVANHLHQKGQLSFFSERKDLFRKQTFRIATVRFKPVVLRNNPLAWVIPVLNLSLKVEINSKAPTRVNGVFGIELDTESTLDGGDFYARGTQEHQTNFMKPGVTRAGVVQLTFETSAAASIDGLQGPVTDMAAKIKLDSNLDADPWWALNLGLTAFAGMNREVSGKEYHSGDLTSVSYGIADAKGPFKGCKPRTCEDLAWECGKGGDGCGGQLECGPCLDSECNGHTCVISW